MLFSIKVDIVSGPTKVKDRTVDMDDVKEYAQRIGINTESIFETSAKTGENVEELFKYVAKIYEKAPGETGNSLPPGLDLSPKEEEKKKKKGLFGLC